MSQFNYKNIKDCEGLLFRQKYEEDYVHVRHFGNHVYVYDKLTGNFKYDENGRAIMKRYDSLDPREAGY